VSIREHTGKPSSATVPRIISNSLSLTVAGVTPHSCLPLLVAGGVEGDGTVACGASVPTQAAYVAYVSIRQHTSVACGASVPTQAAYVSIRQHMSAYVSIRQHASVACGASVPTQAAYFSIRQHTSAYASIRQHTSAYVCAHPVAGCFTCRRKGGRGQAACPHYTQHITSILLVYYYYYSNFTSIFVYITYY
jgi:hypothetical protein